MAKQPRRKQRVTEPRHQIAAGLSVTRKQHDLIRDHVKNLLNRYKGTRSSLISKLAAIDREYNGYIKLSQDEKKIEQENIRGEGLKPTSVNLMLADAQVDEIVTYLLSVLASDTDMYTAVTEKDKQYIAEAFTKVMNMHNDQFDHYSNYAAGFLNALKYNMAAWVIEWSEVYGTSIEPDNEVGTGFSIVQEITKSGNELQNLDPYNLIWDAAVPFTKLHSHGEYFGKVELVTSFRIRRMEETKEIYLPPKYDLSSKVGKSEYYESRPEITTVESTDGTRAANWHYTFAAAQGQAATKGLESFSHELVHVYCWIPPKVFGLSESAKMEIWRFTLLDGEYIISGTKLDNAHGMLPIATTRPIDDGFEIQTKSVAQKLLPMQRFASFLVNTHQQGTRKALFGLNIYDAAMVDIQNLDHEQLFTGWVPANVTDKKALSSAVTQINDTPDTSNTLIDVGHVMELMQQLVPSSIAKQVAGLERATLYQAAATVQGSNRRNLKLAKLVNAQAMTAVRMMMATNIMQFQTDMEIVDPDTGNKIQVNPSEFRSTDLAFTISEGLKGIDRLLVIEGLKEVIHMLLQSNQAGNINFVSLIDHWLSMFGDMTDFSQFEFKSAIDSLNPQQKEQAMAVYQQWLQQQQGGGNVAPTGAPAPV